MDKKHLRACALSLCTLAFGWALPGSAAAQHKTPTEAQCRTMVDGMLQTMRATPAQLPQRERERANEVNARAEKIVADHRARGASECDAWAAIGRLVAHQ